MSKEEFYCRKCLVRNDYWLLKCPRCGEQAFMVPVGMELPDTQTPKPVQEETDLEDAFDPNAKEFKRISTGYPGFDRVLGGGLVVEPPCVIQFGAPQGSGKSTLLLKTGDLIAAAYPVIYFSSEETRAAISVRSRRFDLKNTDRLKLVCSKSCDVFKQKIEQYKPVLAIVDSLSKMHLGPEVEIGKRPKRSAYSTLEVASDVIDIAQKYGTSVILINHMTKEGEMAGLNEIGHDVDAVLFLDGDPRGKYRKLYATKSRIGPTTEQAIFTMTKTGLVEGPIDDGETVMVSATTGKLRSRMVEKSRRSAHRN